VAPDGRVVTACAAHKARRPVARKPGRRKPLCIRSPEGFELHADVHVTAAERAGLERLCRDIARPALCSDRRTELPDGRIEFRLKRAWKGGVRALVLEPIKLIARMAALIPRPRAHMRRAHMRRAHIRRFYGVFNSAHPQRGRVVPQPPDPKKTGRPVAPKRPARMQWADLPRRCFKIEVLRCPYCGAAMRIIVVVHNPTAIAAIIAAVEVAAPASQLKRTLAIPRGPPDERLRGAA
jgi:hypothetical protein